MNYAASFELNQTRKHLEYYKNLKQQVEVGSQPSAHKTHKQTSIDKWIDIYSERIKKLERQMTKLGLKTHISNPSAHASDRQTPSASSVSQAS